MAQRDIDAVIFDLDGVVTKTATLHAAAWKELFDDVLREVGEREGRVFEPFDADRDYRRYVDGKPRFDGVRSFLDARGIRLPPGDPDDSPRRTTMHGLGNRKNELFLERLRDQGVETYASTIALIRALKRQGRRVAIVSASKNCRELLRAAAIEDLFDARVDGVESERLKLEGKPAPDIFIEAARRLGTPRRRAAVVEDALAGVEAGRRGEFGLVIGVDRSGHADDLAASGADVVVPDLSDLDPGALGLDQREEEPLPSALDRFEEIAARLRQGRAAVFLDYDGTLTPIVARPELARLDDAMRRRVAGLAERCPVAVISGRDLKDLRSLVGLDSLYYAGSHGFEIGGPGGWSRGYSGESEFRAAVEAAARELHRRLGGIEGVLVEDKALVVAVHVRLVDPAETARVEGVVDEVAAAHPRLRKERGKKVFEIRPDIDWHKGRVVAWFLDEWGLGNGDAVPVYLGDDLTDEDGFVAVERSGIGILVSDEPRATAASYVLADSDEVGRFLSALEPVVGR